MLCQFTRAREPTLRENNGRKVVATGEGSWPSPLTQTCASLALIAPPLLAKPRQPLTIRLSITQIFPQPRKPSIPTSSPSSMPTNTGEEVTSNLRFQKTNFKIATCAF
ncbi:unnamed protein product [Linum trigynum]|uniref:Uncharacterized protein n=1 Tax=Linum trigynum TaxID=586398 RepID=A0AAV2GTD7_9ROSI